jgi:hypothetical protein
MPNRDSSGPDFTHRRVQHLDQARIRETTVLADIKSVIKVGGLLIQWFFAFVMIFRSSFVDKRSGSTA